jgi:lipopolysaccharide/colanic/teichoic acid biosynthesis glycosyltransferase
MYRRIVKGLIDRVAAFLLIVLLSPVLVIVAVVVRAFLGTPVFFRQTRPGLDEQLFTLIKFRTMHQPAEDEVRKPDGDRLTALGVFLRSTSLDELPELFNVLGGTMSLVGPRPLLVEYLERYSPEQRRRHEVKPGLTGLAQVNGRNGISWEEKFRYDVWYVDHLSFVLDLRIILKTIVAIVTRRGVTEPGHATAREFAGHR